MLQPDPNTTTVDYTGNPYPFGMDPVWKIFPNFCSILRIYEKF